MPTTARACLAVACPKCHRWPGIACYGAVGALGVHAARPRAYRAAHPRTGRPKGEPTMQCPVRVPVALWARFKERHGKGTPAAFRAMLRGAVGL